MARPGPTHMWTAFVTSEKKKKFFPLPPCLPRPPCLPPSSASSAAVPAATFSQPLWRSNEEKGAVALLIPGRLGCSNTRLFSSGIIFVYFSGKQTIHCGFGISINRMQAGRKPLSSGQLLRSLNGTMVLICSLFVVFFKVYFMSLCFHFVIDFFQFRLFLFFLCGCAFWFFFRGI